MKLVGRFLQVGFIIAAAAGAYSFIASAADGELRKSCVSTCALMPAYAGDNRVAPEVDLVDMQGQPFRLSQLRGKTVVLAFWTTSCEACKRQMPSLAMLAQLLEADPRFALVTVAVDESAELARKTLQNTVGHPQPFRVLLDPEGRVVRERYGTQLFPETWIIDPQGIIRARFDGERDWSSPLVRDLLVNVSRGNACDIEVQARVATGAGAGVCREEMMR